MIEVIRNSIFISYIHIFIYNLIEVLGNHVAHTWSYLTQLIKISKIGGQGGTMRVSGEDKDFRYYLLLAKRMGGYCFRNF
jgi:hypothetical protein